MSMNILHIAYISNSPFEGVSIIVPQYLRVQQSLGCNVCLINVKNLPVENIPNQIFVDGKFKVKDLEGRFPRPDLVVFHETYRKQYPGIARRLIKDKIPYIIVAHGSLTNKAQHIKWLKKKAANILLFNRYINGARAIQLLSQRECDETRFGKRKFVSTNGVNMPGIRKETFSEEGVKFCFIGRLDAYVKGLDLLMEGIAKIKQELLEKKVRFYIYGPDYKGRYDNVKRLIEENNVGDIVTLSHEVTGDKKRDVLLSSDVFIQASRTEGMPLGILEALSYGIPCLVARGTNLGPEIEEYKAGWMAENDAGSLADAILRAVGDRENYADYGKNAVSLVEDRYTWDVIMKKTIDVYEEIING